MKIRTDVEQILQNRPPQNFVRTQQSTINRPQQQPSIAHAVDQSVMDRLGTERSLNDALNIAQLSQTLLQKAMVVSSRLRNIAEQAIVTGRTDDDELRSAMADIQSSMKQYGETIAPPQVNATGGNRMPAIPEIPQVKGDIEAVMAAAGQFGNGVIPGPAAIADLNNRVSRSLEQTGQAVSQIQGRLRGVMGAYPLPGNFNAAVTVHSTANLIGDNPASALGAQGNISRDTAVRLLGA